MLLYIIKSAAVLTSLFICFVLLMRKSTLHSFNRMLLQGILVLAIVLPMVNIPTEHPTTISKQMYETVMLNPREETTEMQAAETMEEQPMEKETDWHLVLCIIYLTGVAAVIAKNLVQALVLRSMVRNGLNHTDTQGNTIVLRCRQDTPFSVFRYIVMSVDDYEEHRRTILTHEQEHIRLHHTYDNILGEVVCAMQWFNPFVWLLRHELRTVHEYEADEAVLNQGIDSVTYQKILMQKAAGKRQLPFANNLNQGALKRRISKMNQKRSNSGNMLKALLALPVVGLLLACFAKPAPPQAASLTILSPHFIPFGKHNFTVHYEGAPVGKGAWVGLYKSNTRPDNSRSLTWVYTDAESGDVIFDLERFDSYYAILFADTSHTELARSESVLACDKVPDISKFRMKTDKRVYNVGEPVVVEWEGAPAFDKDWIGIYKAGTTPGSAHCYSSSYRYVGGATSGKTVLNTPESPNFHAPIEPGDYYVSYLMCDWYTELSSRVPFIVVGK